MNNTKISTNRNFGIVFFIFFLLVSFYPLINGSEIRVWALLISLAFFTLGILNSKLLMPLNKLWHKFGILLGKIVSPVVMGIIFFFVVTPTGILMKILKKDLLNLKFNDSKSYWMIKKEPISRMKNQF